MSNNPTTNLVEPLDALIGTCNDMRLLVSGQQARRLKGIVVEFVEKFPSLERDHCEGALDAIENSVRHVELTVEDELSFKAHLELSADQAALYEIASPFGDAASLAFPSAGLDIEEAAKCLALDRATACVFHLMRAVEVGLRALGKSLKDPALDPARNPSWESILRKCRTQVDLPLAKRCEEWRADDAFFSEATANLTVVKNAWRNRTVHPGKSYDPERATEVFLAVKAFMRHLATKLAEEPSAQQVVE